MAEVSWWTISVPSMVVLFSAVLVYRADRQAESQTESQSTQTQLNAFLTRLFFFRATIIMVNKDAYNKFQSLKKSVLCTKSFILARVSITSSVLKLTFCQNIYKA